MSVGYGDGRVSIGTTMVGRVAVTRVTAVPALTPRIRLDLSWTLGHIVSGDSPGAYLIIDFGGELRLGAGDLLGGPETAEAADRLVGAYADVLVRESRALWALKRELERRDLVGTTAVSCPD